MCWSVCLCVRGGGGGGVGPFFSARFSFLFFVADQEQKQLFFTWPENQFIL